MLLRLLLWTWGAWFCLDFQRSVQNASQNHLLGGWRAELLCSSSHSSLLERVLTPRDVNSLTLINQWTWIKWAPRGITSIKGVQGRKQRYESVNPKWEKACPELSTPATAKSEVRLSGLQPAHQILSPEDMNWASESLISWLVALGQEEL